MSIQPTDRRCTGDNCPSALRCQRYTERNAGTQFAAFWVRRDGNWCESIIRAGQTKLMATANFPYDDMGRAIA